MAESLRRPYATTRVAGHGLLHEGRPVVTADCCGYMGGSNHGQRNHYDRHGHGIREHKAAVLAASPQAGESLG